MKNSKDKKIILLFIIPILLGVAAMVALYFYLTPMKTTIYVFKDNYKAGTIVSDSILVPLQVDSTIVYAGAKSDAGNFLVTGNNKREMIETKENALRMDVAKGMPLMQSMLSIDGGSYIEMMMDGKKVAVTVSVNNVTGVTSDLKEGSRVNIFSTETGGTTRLAFTNMRVLTVSKNKDGDLVDATIEVSNEEAPKLINLAHNTNITFGLVNGSTYQSPDGYDSYMPEDNNAGTQAVGTVESAVAGGGGE